MKIRKQCPKLHKLECGDRDGALWDRAVVDAVNDIDGSDGGNSRNVCQPLPPDP